VNHFSDAHELCYVIEQIKRNLYDPSCTTSLIIISVTGVKRIDQIQKISGNLDICRCDDKDIIRNLLEIAADSETGTGSKVNDTLGSIDIKPFDI
jgi:hypothetical protein